MASIILLQVRKSFGEVCVLEGVDLHIRDEEFVVLVGPSGCGKSTLLRMIAGLESVSGGEIEIDGVVVNDLMPKDRDIAMVFQNYALYPTMNVFENMAFNLKIKRMNKGEVDSRVMAAAATLDLSRLLERLPGQLSGGQRQRVAMGRAIVRKPRAFLFDEPLSNLDAKLRVQMRTEIKELHQRLQTTAVYVTHDQVEAMTMADRIIVMNQGRVEQIGTPDEVFDDPVNLFVAEFIGSPAMNMLRGEVTQLNGQTAFSTGGEVLEVRGDLAIVPGHDAIYGIRPEHIVLDDEGIPVRVNVVESLGIETLVFCDLAGTEICMKVFDRYRPRSGDVIRIRPRVEAMSLFDAESGRRVAHV